jgi:hypothetical protein
MMQQPLAEPAEECIVLLSGRTKSGFQVKPTN